MRLQIYNINSLLNNKTVEGTMAYKIKELFTKVKQAYMEREYTDWKYFTFNDDRNKRTLYNALTEMHNIIASDPIEYFFNIQSGYTSWYTLKNNFETM